MNLKEMEKPKATESVDALADAIVAGWRSPFSSACATGELRHEASIVVDDETGLVIRTRVPVIKPLFARGANGHLGAVED